MNLYERYLALPQRSAEHYGQWLQTHDTCPDCCPGREDKRKADAPCERCGGSGVVEIESAPIPVEPLLRGRDLLAQKKKAKPALQLVAALRGDEP